jgi:hypothetical protein
LSFSRLAALGRTRAWSHGIGHAPGDAWSTRLASHEKSCVRIGNPKRAIRVCQLGSDQAMWLINISFQGKIARKQAIKVCFWRQNKRFNCFGFFTTGNYFHLEFHAEKGLYQGIKGRFFPVWL